jgi:hypothetical protein
VDDLVPLDVDGARIVGLELQLTALEPDDLAGDAVTIRQRDHIGSRLRQQRCGQDQHESGGQPDTPACSASRRFLLSYRQ